jgi:predicted Co/Zn/Cd cation transporter (cation efflux family)
MVGERTQTWAMRTAVVAAVGLMLGFAIGWWIWPVQYTNTAPDVLRQDYRDDYVVMVATAHEVEQDLEQARNRLKLLDPEEPAAPAAPVVELAERLVEAGGSAEDITYLARLAWALGNLPPTLAPYLDGRP